MDPRLTSSDTAEAGDGGHLSQGAICPGCHTQHPSLTGEGLAAGVGWKCARCGQRWDARRLASVASYQRWVANRDALESGRNSP